MSLEATLKNHPLIVLLGAGFVVASATAGVMAYLMTHNTQAAALKAEAQRTLAEMEMKTEIAELKSRFVKIERRVGSEEQPFVDVSKLVVTRDRIRELDSTYKTMEGGAFYIAEPAMKSWRYALTSELEMLREMRPEDARSVGAFEPILAKKNVHMWRMADPVTLFPRGKVDTKGRMTFFTHVFVQIYTDQDLQAMARVIASSSQREGKADELLDDLEQATRAQKSDSKPTPKDPTEAEASAKAAARTEQALARLFRGDLAAIFLGAVVLSNLQMVSEIEDAQFEVVNAQKKGNVLYLQGRTEFANATIEGKDAPTRLLVDLELFVITAPNALMLVKVMVPSFDGRGEAHSWIGQWLTGLRVSMGR